MSPGNGENSSIFTRLTAANVISVTVIGPDKGTRWDYSIRCRAPQSNLFGRQVEELTGFEWSNTESAHDEESKNENK